MHQHNVAKPPQIAALDTDPRGFPIFYIIQPPPGRDLNFRVVNPNHMVLCATRKLCGVCGQSLPYRFWFIAGPEAAHDRIFGEPPLHRECMEYSLAVCPFLVNAYEPLHKPLDNLLFVSDPVKRTARTTEIVLYETRGLKLVIDRGSVFYRADAFTKIERRAWNGERWETV